MFISLKDMKKAISTSIIILWVEILGKSYYMKRKKLEGQKESKGEESGSKCIRVRTLTITDHMILGKH